ARVVDQRGQDGGVTPVRDCRGLKRRAQGPALGLGLVRKGVIHRGQGEFGGIFRRDRPLSMIHRSGLQDVSYREGAAGQYSGLRSSRLRSEILAARADRELRDGSLGMPSPGRVEYGKL